MRHILVAIAILGSVSMRAQILDTSDVHVYRPLNTFSVSEKGLDLLHEDSLPIDTQLSGFSGNYPLLMSHPFLDLGYEGSPALLLDEYQLPAVALDPGFGAYDPYRYDLQIHRYHTDRPFTRLNYSQGQNELIYIEAQHGQQFSERLSLGIDYRRIKNHNFYYSNVVNGERVKFTDLFNTKIYSGFYNVDRSYELLAAYVWNKNDQTATGGLQDPAEFENSSGLSKTFNHPVWMTNAQSQFKEHRFKVKQYFRYRAAPLDTLHPHRLDRFRAQWVLLHQLDKTTYSFQDQAPNPQFYGDSIAAYEDTLQHLRFSQTVGHQWMSGRFTVFAGLRYAMDQMRMDDIHLQYHSTYLELWGRVGSWEARMDLGSSGFNAGDHSIELTQSGQWKETKHHLRLFEQATQPNYLATRLRFGPHSWDLETGRTQAIGFEYDGSMSRPYGHLNWTTSAMRLTNPIYYSGDTATRWSNSLWLYHIKLGYRAEARYLGTELTAGYSMSSNGQVLPRPGTYARARVYLKLLMFKRNLSTQWGLETYGMESFNAPTYRPDLIQWVNGPNNQPFYAPITAYINARVKNFCFAFSFYHIQQGWMGESYFSSPGRPIMPNVIRFNLRWDLGN